MSFDRRWLDEQGSEDCHGRALWALGVGVGRSPYRSFQIMAGQLFALALPALTEFTSPRAWAFGLIGIHEYLGRLSGDSLANQTRETLTFRLMEWSQPDLKPIAPHQISGGTNRRNAPSTGSSAGTISDWKSILPKQGAVAMGSTWIGSTGTRERNQPWPFCFRSRRCTWRKIF